MHMEPLSSMHILGQNLCPIGVIFKTIQVEALGNFEDKKKALVLSAHFWL